MSVLGKFLAFLNLIAVAAFVYIAMMDFARHNNWSFGNASLERKLTGEPVDKSEQDVEGKIKAEDFDAYQLNTLPLLNGKPLTEQELEVKDVESKLRKTIDSADPLEVGGLKLTTKEQKLAWALRSLAENFARRNGLLHVMNGSELTTDDALGIFEKTYKEDVGNQVKAAETAARQNLDKPAYKADLDKELAKIYSAAAPARLENDFDEAFKKVYSTKAVEEKRKAIARVLFATCEALREYDKPVPQNVFDSKQFPRVQSIIGMVQTIEQIENQTTNLGKMVLQCDYLMANERDIFVGKHDDALRSIVDLKSRLYLLTRQREAKEADVKLEEGLVDAQEKIVARLTQELQDARAATDKKLGTKKEMEDALLKEQIKLRNIVASIQELAGQLRNLEERFPRREAEPR